MASEYEDEDGSRAYTPFGVLVGDAGSLKSFDDETFYNEVLLPSEKDKIKKNKEAFLKDPEAKHTVQEVSNSFKFIPWDSLVIKSNARNGLVFDRILSNTWSLNKEAIPDFINLIEKLRQKYSTVLGDDKLLQNLEAAQHRARELEASNDIPEAATSSRKITSGLSPEQFEQGINEAAEVIYKYNTGDSFSYDGQKLYQELVSMGFGQKTAEIACDATDGIEDLDQIKKALRRNVLGDWDPTVYDDPEAFSSRKITSAQEGVNEQAYNNYIQQLLQKGIPEEQARQMADNLVNQIQQNNAELAANVQQPDQGQGDAGMFSSKRIISGADPSLKWAAKRFLKDGNYPNFRVAFDDIYEKLSERYPGDNPQAYEDAVGEAWEDMQSRWGTLGSSLNINGGNGMGTYIKSEGDFNMDDEEKDGGEFDVDSGTTESGSTGGDELTDESGGESDAGGFDFGGADGEPEDGFMDEVNSIDDFGADSPDLSKEEVVDAVQAIKQIVETVLATEGTEDSRDLTSDEMGYTLDEVDDLAAGYDSEDEGGEGMGDSGVGFEEPVTDEEVDEELPDELSASLVRVVQVGTPIKSNFIRPYVSAEKFNNEPALVCQGLFSSLNAEDKLVPKDVVFETIVLSHVSKVDDKTPIISGFTTVGSFKTWIKQSSNHRRAWKIASSKIKRLLGQAAKTPREKSAVMALASSYYDKWFKADSGKLNKLFSGKSVKAIRKVGMALQNRFANNKSLHILTSDYNGYRNYQTWNASVYISNDAKFNEKAKAFIKSGTFDYDQFLKSSGLAGGKTPDGVAWSDPKIDRGEMKEVLQSLTSSYKSNKGKGMQGVKSATQVDGSKPEVVTVQDKTPTGIDLGGKTLSSPEIEDPNTEKVTNVNGGDTSEYVDVHNTGDDGSLEADVKAGTENNESEYGFDSQEMVGLELPIENDPNTQVLELKSIGSGVYVLNRSFTSPGSGRVTFLKSNAARKLVTTNTKPSPIKANVDRVLTLKDSKNALLVRSSSVLGVIAIEAPFQKGLKNAKYSVFSRSGINLVNDEGYFISAPRGPQKIIASAVSNKSARQGTERKNIFAEIESAYIQHLKGTIHSLVKSNANLQYRLDTAVKTYKRQGIVNSQLLNKERNSAREQVASAMQNLNSLKTQTATAEAQRIMSSAQNTLSEEVKAEKERNQRAIDYLVSIM